MVLIIEQLICGFSRDLKDISKEADLSMSLIHKILVYNVILARRFSIRLIPPSQR